MESLSATYNSNSIDNLLTQVVSLLYVHKLCNSLFMGRVYLCKEQISTQVWQVFVSGEKQSLCTQHNLF